jgi:hypothetical protein
MGDAVVIRMPKAMTLGLEPRHVGDVVLGWPYRATTFRGGRQHREFTFLGVNRGEGETIVYGPATVRL